MGAIHAYRWHTLALLAGLTACGGSSKAVPNMPPDAGKSTEVNNPRNPEPLDAGRVPVSPTIGTDYVGGAEFYVHNGRCDDLRAETTSRGGQVTVTVPAMSTTPVAQAGGCCTGEPPPKRPSAWFTKFRLLAGDEVVYEGLRDADWDPHGVLWISGAGVKCEDAGAAHDDAGSDTDGGDELDAGAELH